MHLPSEDVKIYRIIKKASRLFYCKVLLALLIGPQENKKQLGLAVVCISPEDFQLSIFNLLVTKCIKSKTNLHYFGRFFITKIYPSS